MKNVVVIAPHPDDETLGCGGTILRHKSVKDFISCVFVTNNIGSSYFEERQKEISLISQFYNFDKIYKLDYLAANLTTSDLPKLVSDFSRIFYEICPDTIYLPFAFDIHSDHRITFEAAVACTKSFRFPFIKKILMYETISETDFSPIKSFLPNYFVDISYFCKKKIEAMHIYKTEILDKCKKGYPRSSNGIMSLAMLRGCAIGRKYAESFQLIKFIDT